MKCPTCSRPMRRLAESSEPEGLRRDAVCKYCDKRFMVTKSHPVELRRSTEDGEEYLVLWRHNGKTRKGSWLIASEQPTYAAALDKLEYFRKEFANAEWRVVRV